jgi:hypothetical protein
MSQPNLTKDYAANDAALKIVVRAWSQLPSGKDAKIKSIKTYLEDRANILSMIADVRMEEEA